jgi:hypothetical protein
MGTILYLSPEANVKVLRGGWKRETFDVMIRPNAQNRDAANTWGLRY